MTFPVECTGSSSSGLLEQFFEGGSFATLSSPPLPRVWCLRAHPGRWSSCTRTPVGCSVMRVHELMAPAPRRIWITQSAFDAANLLDHQNSAIVVVDLSGLPVGLVTQAAISREATHHPDRWSKVRCAHVMEALTCRLGPEDSIECVLAQYRDGGPRPLLVFSGDNPIGTLYPEDVLASSPQLESSHSHPASHPSALVSDA